jgi:hypothetical protein
MERRLSVAEGQHTLEVLKQLLINGMLEHRITNRLKVLSMSIQLRTHKPVALELKLLRNDLEPPTYYLEVFSYFQDGSGPAHMDPDVIEMTTNPVGFITHVNC